MTSISKLTKTANLAKNLWSHGVLLVNCTVVIEVTKEILQKSLNTTSLQIFLNFSLCKNIKCGANV